MNKDIQLRSTYVWIEETFKKDIEKRIEERHMMNVAILKESNAAIIQIRDAMVGTLEKAGFVSKLTSQGELLKRLENQVNKLCDWCKYSKDPKDPKDPKDYED